VYKPDCLHLSPDTEGDFDSNFTAAATIMAFVKVATINPK
jgi:hypothetical protein